MSDYWQQNGGEMPNAIRRLVEFTRANPVLNDDVLAHFGERDDTTGVRHRWSVNAHISWSSAGYFLAGNIFNDRQEFWRQIFAQSYRLGTPRFDKFVHEYHQLRNLTPQQIWDFFRHALECMCKGVSAEPRPKRSPPLILEIT